MGVTRERRPWIGSFGVRSTQRGSGWAKLVSHVTDQDIENFKALSDIMRGGTFNLDAHLNLSKKDGAVHISFEIVAIFLQPYSIAKTAESAVFARENGAATRGNCNKCGSTGLVPPQILSFLIIGANLDNYTYLVLY